MFAPATTASPGADRAQQERERKAQLDRKRASASRRGYDRQWQRVRALKLQGDPICETKGCGRPATVVDHRRTIASRPDLRLDLDNLRSLCKPCHDRHTAKEQGFARRRRPPDGAEG